MNDRNYRFIKRTIQLPENCSTFLRSDVEEIFHDTFIDKERLQELVTSAQLMIHIQDSKTYQDVINKIFLELKLPKEI